MRGMETCVRRGEWQARRAADLALISFDNRPPRGARRVPGPYGRAYAPTRHFRGIYLACIPFDGGVDAVHGVAEEVEVDFEEVHHLCHLAEDQHLVLVLVQHLRGE